MTKTFKTRHLLLTLMAVLSFFMFTAAAPGRAQEAPQDTGISIEEYAALAQPLLDESHALYREYNALLSELDSGMAEDELENRKKNIAEMYLAARGKCLTALLLAGQVTIDSESIPVAPKWFSSLFGEINNHAQTMIYEYAVKVKPALASIDSVPEKPAANPAGEHIRLECEAAEEKYKAATNTATETCDKTTGGPDHFNCMEAMKQAAFAEMKYAKKCGM